VNHEPGIHMREFPEGATLDELGIDIDTITTVGGLQLVGGGMYDDGPLAEPIGAVIIKPLARNGGDMEPLAIIQTAARLRQLRDQFWAVFDKAADAAEELFDNGGKLPGEGR